MDEAEKKALYSTCRKSSRGCSYFPIFSASHRPRFSRRHSRNNQKKRYTYKSSMVRPIENQQLGVTRHRETTQVTGRPAKLSQVPRDRTRSHVTSIRYHMTMSADHARPCESSARRWETRLLLIWYQEISVRHSTIDIHNAPLSIRYHKTSVKQRKSSLTT